MGNKHAQTIREFYRHAKRMPTYREMLGLFGYHSKNAVYKLLKKLEKFEVVRKDKSHKLVPGRLFHAVIVAGTVEAGFPSPAEEELSDTMSLDEYLIKNKEATYMLKVSGDSMIDAGIMQGDMVLVERGTEAKDGQIVVAEVDGQWTMKYFRKRRSKVFLEAANKKYKPIYPKENLKIAAVVMAVIRRY
jgi:SOS regulatory protein LexA